MATRYGIRSGCYECGPNYTDHDLIPVPDGMPDEPGFVVLLSEHRAAVAEAEQRGRNEAANEIDTVAYLLGKRDGRSDALREAFGDLSIEEFVAEAEQRGRDLGREDTVLIHEAAAERRGYEQGQRDERDKWARIRAEVAAIHVWDDGQVAIRAEALAIIDAGGESVPRILTADDPEPALRSIVTDLIGDAWQSYMTAENNAVWVSTSGDTREWSSLIDLAPITLVHDAGGES
jgi:hypothetical protein